MQDPILHLILLLFTYPSRAPCIIFSSQQMIYLISGISHIIGSTKKLSRGDAGCKDTNKKDIMPQQNMDKNNIINQL